MMLTVFILTILTLGAYGQDTELICYNPGPPPADAIGSRSDPSLIQPLIKRATELTEPQLEGLSIEEAAIALPEIVNTTSFILLQEAIAEGAESFNPADITIVTLQSVLNTTNGIEIFNTMIQEPQNFVRLFTTVVSNFDLDCMDNPNLVFLTLLTTLMADLLQEPFRDSFVDVFNTTTVIVARQSNLTDAVVSVLEPLSEDLDEAENVEGSLLSLLSFVSDDAITVALSSALESSGFILQPKEVGALLTVFFRRIQDGFGIDGEEFVSFINDIFKGILEALT